MTDQSKSIITKHQVKKITKNIIFDGKHRIMTCFIRYDDDCNNGHNSFSITGEIKNSLISRNCIAGGCIHDEVKEYFPEYAHLIKWHLCSSDEPMHYLANTLYFVKKGDFDAARNSAIWQDVTDDELKSFDIEQKLKARLPKLMEEFQNEMEKLGFVF